jgi:basic membrane protein A
MKRGALPIPARVAFALVAFGAALACGLASCSPGKASSKAGGKSAHVRAALALQNAARVRGDADSLAWSAFYSEAEGRQGTLDADETKYRFGDAVSLRVARPSGSGMDRAQLARVLAEEGNGLVVLVGPSYAPIALDLAPKYPETHFAVIDARLSEPDMAKAGPNVLWVNFSPTDGAYLAGALSALVTSQADSPHFAFIGPKDDSLALESSKGFAAGLCAANPSLQDRSRIHLAFAPDVVADPPLDLARGFARLNTRIIYWQSGFPAPAFLDLARSQNQLVISEGAAYPSSLSVDPRARDTSSALLAVVVRRYDQAITKVLDAYFGAGPLPQGKVEYGVAEGCVELAIGEDKGTLTSPHLLDYGKFLESLKTGHKPDLTDHTQDQASAPAKSK